MKALIACLLMAVATPAFAALKVGAPAPDFTIPASQGGKEFTFRWCQGCHLWTTNIRGHQFRHFTGHPNDRYPESSQPSKSTSQSAPRLERRDRRRNSTRDARRDSSSRTESCPPERSGSQPRHPSANVASAPATAPGPLPMFPSFDPMLMAAMVQSYHAFHAQQSQQNKK